MNIESQQIRTYMQESEVIISKYNGTYSELKSYEIPPKYNKIMESQIIQDEVEREKVLALLNKFKNIQLLYSGQVDGFKAITFHEKCDKQGETLTLVKSKKH